MIVKIRLIINIILVVIVFGAWAKMFFDTEGGVLASSGIKSLRYFTVLSNIGEGIVSLLWVIVYLTGGNTAVCDRAKFVFCIAVTLTFGVVTFFFGPLYGWLPMYRGSNFWFHLIVPLAAIAEFVFLNRTPIGIGTNLLALIPMTVYGIGYLGNIRLHGIEGNDWYGFLKWGVLPCAGICLVQTVCSFVVGLLLCRVNELFR